MVVIAKVADPWIPIQAFISSNDPRDSGAANLKVKNSLSVYVVNTIGTFLLTHACLNRT